MASGGFNGSGNPLSSSSEFEISPVKSINRIPWDSFSCWISCFCVVTFDLELGQVIEKIFPEHYSLSDVEKSNICYLAFPDSNTGCMGDTQFHFRICSMMNSSKSKNCDFALQKDKDHYYGFVSFRQVKDTSIKRGYFQKSVVLLSRLPYINLFSYLVKHIAPEYFQNGEIALETVCSQIDKWENPVPGRTIQLPVIGHVLQFTIPQAKKTGMFTARQIVASTTEFSCLYQPKLYKCFHSLLPHLHLLWELILLAEPMVVMAPSPALSSEGVQSLVNLIHPLQYVCDHRPYFTIHDSDLKEFANKTQVPPNAILGVTNPFFAKTLQHWPHIIRIGEMPTLTLPKNGKMSHDLKPGIYTKYKTYLNRDKVFLKWFSKSGGQPVEFQNKLLIDHMLELTQSFMIPLERYIGSLMPLQRYISPWKAPPKLRRFNTEEFIRTLSANGPHLTCSVKGNWQGLYQKFFKSPNFEAWFEAKKEEVNNKLEILHIEELCKADISEWLKGKDEVEIVNLCMQLRLKFATCNNPYITRSIKRKLHGHITCTLRALPADLKSVVQKSI